MAALQAGASVNGSPEAHWPPIAAATMANEVSMVEYFLRRGADPNRPVKIDPPCPRWHAAVAVPGERDLHIAAGNGYNEIVRLSLKGSRADPNGTDNRGGTPLMASCENLNVSVEVVPLLLEAGADQAFASENGVLALHMVALHRNVEIINMLYSRAPATLTVCTSNGVTPLFLSCSEGHEGIVSKLLSLGEVQPMPLDANNKCPISVAVEKGFVGVVRVLINQGGVRAVGGREALRYALCIAICYHQARILRLLLAAVDGENGRYQWTNINLGGNHLLHFAAGYCNPVGVSILLEAGADEAARDAESRTPQGAIGLDLERDGIGTGGEKIVAIRRMLQRGTAYRARSWAWHFDEESGACVTGHDDTTTAVAAADPSFPKAVHLPPVTAVRVIRPTDNHSSKLFVRAISYT